MNAFGAGLASIAFAAVNVLPYGWRALYVIGGGTLMILAYYRRWLPETTRFELRRQELASLGSKTRATLDTLCGLVREHPGRLALLRPERRRLRLRHRTGHRADEQISAADPSLSPGPDHVALHVSAGSIAVAGQHLRRPHLRPPRPQARAAGLRGGIGRRPSPFSTAASAAGCCRRRGSLAIFGFLAADALLAGLAVEIFPTAYRATVSGIRYFTVILFGRAGARARRRVLRLLRRAMARPSRSRWPPCRLRSSASCCLPETARRSAGRHQPRSSALMTCCVRRAAAGLSHHRAWPRCCTAPASCRRPPGTAWSGRPISSSFRSSCSIRWRCANFTGFRDLAAGLRASERHCDDGRGAGAAAHAAAH